MISKGVVYENLQKLWFFKDFVDFEKITIVNNQETFDIIKGIPI